MVDPSEQMQNNYKFLLALEDEIINLLVDGVKLSDLYEKIKQKCQKEQPQLVEKLTPNLGYPTFKILISSSSKDLNIIHF